MVHRTLCRRLDKSMEMAAHDSHDCFVPGVHDCNVRRDKPAAVRFARSGAGVGRRLPHRIQFDEVCVIFSRRIRRDDYRLCCNRHIILWGLAFPGNSRRLTWMDIWPDQHRSLLRKSDHRDFVFHVGPLDAAALSLRSTHAARLAFLLLNCPREYFSCRSNSSFHFKVMNLETRRAGRIEKSLILDSWLPD